MPFRRLSLNPLEFSSHGNPWRPHPSGLLIPELRVWGHGGHPQHLTMRRCVVGCCFYPRPQKPRVSYPEAPRPPLGPGTPPGPGASPDPVAVPKHGVAAERPVDVQAYLRDVPGGDQGLLLHFLRENRGGGASIRDTDPDLSPAAVLGREPWGHWECVLPKPPSFPWEAGDGGSVHHAHGTSVRACAQLLWAGR